jgi:ABC-2 type transport system permease protein
VNAVGLVARREILERTRERSFAIGTLVTIVIVAAIIVLPSIFGGGTDTVHVAVATPDAARVAQAAAQGDKPFDVEVVVRRVGSDAEARRLLRDDKVDVALTASGIVRRGGTPDGGVAALQAAATRLRQLDALRKAGASPSILDPAPLRESTVDADAEDRQGFAAVALIILYGQLIGYGIWVATGVVEEKTSRIVEILLATIRPRELLAGKVVGIGVVGLLQLLFIGAVGLVLAAVSDRVDVGGRELSALPIVLAWFIGGYAMYACAFAVVGAIVPRQEDVQSTATPVMLALLGSFFLSFNAVSDPSSGIAKVLTFIPTSSPLVMPVRVIAGSVPAWEVVVSVLILLATIAALVLIAGRVYGNAVLQTGGKVRLRAALAPASRA